MTKQIVTQMELHQDGGYHTYYQFFWANGHIDRIESEFNHNSEAAHFHTTPTHELSEWNKNISLDDWLEATEQFESKIVD